jgi:hypothetical protein
MLSKQYLAGFIDGEGYLSVITHSDTRTKRGFTLQPIIAIGSVDKVILDEISKITTGKFQSRKKTKNHKQIYALYIQDLEGIKLCLKKILPYLIIKKQQATLLNEYVKLRLKNKNKVYSERELEIAKIFKTINKRGDKGKD